MGILTKLFKVAADPVKKKTDIVSKKVIDLTSRGTIKTTAAVAGQGVSRATAGGQKIVSKIAVDTAKGAGTTARVGGKVIAGTAIAAVPALTGIGIVNYYKTSSALTDADRRLGWLLDRAKEADDLGYDPTTGDPSVDRDPTSRGDTGVGGDSDAYSWNPFKEAYDEDADKADTTAPASSMGLVLGLAAVAGGLYMYSKKKKYKK